MAWRSYSQVLQWPSRMVQTSSVFTDTGFFLPHYDPAGPAFCPFSMLQFPSPTALADFDVRGAGRTGRLWPGLTVEHSGKGLGLK